MTQMKFHEYHVKRSEFWLVMPTPRQPKSTVWTRISCHAFFFIRPGYEA